MELFALLAIKVMKAEQICSPQVISTHLLSQTNWFLFFMLCWSYCPCSLRSAALPPALLLCPTEPPLLSPMLSPPSLWLSHAIPAQHIPQHRCRQPLMPCTTNRLPQQQLLGCRAPCSLSLVSERSEEKDPQGLESWKPNEKEPVWILKSVWFLRPDVILKSISDSSVLIAYTFAASCHPFSLLFLINYVY